MSTAVCEECGNINPIAAKRCLRCDTVMPAGRAMLKAGQMVEAMKAAAEYERVESRSYLNVKLVGILTIIAVGVTLCVLAYFQLPKMMAPKWKAHVFKGGDGRLDFPNYPGAAPGNLNIRDLTLTRLPSKYSDYLYRVEFKVEKAYTYSEGSADVTLIFKDKDGGEVGSFPIRYYFESWSRDYKGDIALYGIPADWDAIGQVTRRN